MGTSNHQPVIAGLATEHHRSMTRNSLKTMTKSIFIVFLLLPVTVFSQQKFEKEFSVAANSGLTFSTIDFLPAIEQHNVAGYNGGISARFISEKHFGVQAELNYSQRGWKSDSILTPRTLHYLELPFLTHLYFGQKKIRFIINLGPKVAYLLSEKSNNLKNELNTTGWHKIDYGLCGGGGLEFHTQKLAYVLEGRYYFGLSDIFPNGKSDDFSRSANRNISVNFAIFWQL